MNWFLLVISSPRMYIDYIKLNLVTRKDHFPLPSIDQILERVGGPAFYCFLDGYSGYCQIEIALTIKIKVHLHVHLVLLLFVECHLDCVMLPLHFKDACLVFLVIWWSNFLKFLWMIYLCLVILLMIV